MNIIHSKFSFGLLILLLIAVGIFVLSVVLYSDAKPDVSSGTAIDEAVMSSMQTFTESTLEDGAKVRRVFAVPQAYAASGSFVPIDTSVVPEDGAGYMNVTNLYQTHFTADATRIQTEINIPGNRTMTVSLEATEPSDAEASANILTYPTLDDGIALEQEVGLAALTQRLIITAGTNPFPFHVGWQVEGGSLVDTDHGGFLLMADGTNGATLVMPKPILYEHIADEELDTTPSQLWSELQLSRDASGITIDLDEAGQGWLDSATHDVVVEIRYQHPLYAMQPGQLYRPGTTSADLISSDPLATKYKIGHYWDVGARGCPDCDIEYQFSGAANLYLDDDTQNILRQARSAELAVYAHRSGSAVESTLPEDTSFTFRYGAQQMNFPAEPATIWQSAAQLAMHAPLGVQGLPTDPPKTSPNCAGNNEQCLVTIPISTSTVVPDQGYLQFFVDPQTVAAQEPGKFNGIYIFGPQTPLAPRLVITYTP